MTPEERAAGRSTVDLGEWQDPLDDRADAMSSATAIAVVAGGFFVLTLLVLCLVAKVVGLW